MTRHGEQFEARHFFGVVPVFLVDDVIATAEYYRDILGFEVDFVYGDEANYGRVARGDVIIDFSRSEPPGRRNSVSAAGIGNGVDALIVVTDVDDLHEEFAARGARIRTAPASQDYGMREFHVEDLNGYVLAITAELPDDDDNV